MEAHYEFAKHSQIFMFLYNSAVTSLNREHNFYDISCLHGILLRQFGRFIFEGVIALFHLEYFVKKFVYTNPRYIIN